jgi:broad specificity phosphatase PhoE
MKGLGRRAPALDLVDAVVLCALPQRMPRTLASPRGASDLQVFACTRVLLELKRRGPSTAPGAEREVLSIASMSELLLYLVRHGRTDWNDAGRWQGAVDIPLNDSGRAQAAALAASLVGRVHAVFASDLLRASETARIVSARLTVPILAFDPELRERGYGVFEGLTSAECEARYPEVWAARQANRNVVPPGGEPHEQVVARMERAMQRVVDGMRTHTGQALVVGHGSSLRMFLERISGASLPGLANLELHEVAYDGARFRAR